MGLDVELCVPPERWAGVPRQVATVLRVVDSGEHFWRLIERVQGLAVVPPLAGQLDLYGEWVLRHIQMPQFLGEIPLLESVAENDSERTVLDAVQLVATKCRDDSRYCLFFIGE